LRDREWQTSPVSGRVHVPRQGRERLLNEAAAMSFIREHSNIPIPTLHCTFEDDGAIYLVMEYVEGVGMDELDDDQREVVKRELDIHLNTMRSLTSHSVGGPSGLVVPPYRVSLKTSTDAWDLRISDTEDLVFCHNDLSQQNVIVDPVSLKINAIIDWEYAGFYPDFFERRFFERLGPSVARDGEEDDSEKLLGFLESRSVKQKEKNQDPQFKHVDRRVEAQ
ncbi:MAG: COP9 signalosome (CSN) subunit, partial [Chaenotheca gracillima]